MTRLTSTLRQLARNDRVMVWAMLAPAMSIILLLFGGAVILAFIQSLNYFPLIGLDDPNLGAYRELVNDTEFWRSLMLTFYIAITSTALSIILGIAAALALRRVFGKTKVLAFFFQLNLPIPHVVGAVAILFLLGQSGLVSRVTAASGLIEQANDFPSLIFDPLAVGIILEYVWKELPFIGTIALAILQSVGADYDELARSLGASRWQRLRHVTLPLLLPGVLSASVIVFAFAFGTFEVPLLLGRSFPAVLPVMAHQRYAATDLTQRPEAMAISVVITITVSLCAWGYMNLSRRYLRKD